MIAVRNFQKFFDGSFVSAFEPISMLKLEWTVKCNFQNAKDHHSNKFFLTLNSTVRFRVLEVSE